MTLKINDQGWIAFRGMKFPVKITEIKDRMFGRTDLLVTPVSGIGSAWISTETFLSGVLIPEEDKNAANPILEAKEGGCSE